MLLPFARRLMAIIGLLSAARGLSAQEPTTTLRSAVEGRRVMDEVFAAVGGREALRSIRSIELEETIRRINGRQGQRPSSPDTGYGRRIVSVDVLGQRIAELRILGIAGNQLADVGRFITPRASTVVNWPNMTWDSVPQATVPQARAGFARRYFLPFLQGLERQPPATTRWLGTTTVNGKPHDAVSVMDAGGVFFTLFVDRQTHLPSRLEQLVVGSGVGDSVDVLQFADYRRVGALLLPHRRYEKRVPDVTWEFRTVRFELDKPIADSVFAVPPGLAPTVPVPPSTRPTSLGPDVYLTPSNYRSVFVVFDDYVLVLEGGGSTAETENTIARIKEVALGKPIRYVVATHFHQDHIAGLRSYIAEEATIVTTADARAPIEALARVRYRLAPDALDRAPRAPVIEVVERERTFKDARHEVRLYQVGPSPHVSQMLIGYLPRERVLFEADLLDIPNGDAVAGGDDTADFAAKVRALGLTFDRLIPVHGEAGTPADLEKSLRRGQARAKCPTDAERRAPCNLDAPTAQTRSGGLSVREIPTRPEGELPQPAIVTPVPTGSHRVGRMTFHAVDSLRKEVMTPDPADFRELMFHVWYPSDASGGTRAAYINGALQDSVFRRTVSFADTMMRVRSSALVNVEMSDATRRYPVILFSHGLGTLSQTYTSFIENLASHGYIVVGVDHAYYSAPYTLPDGRSVRNLSSNANRQRDVVAQAEDLSFVVNVLERLNQAAASPPTRLTGRLDFGQLGVFGHSRGGFASPHACRRDLRFKACANLDGYSMTPAVMDSGITQPFMLVEEIAPWDPPPTDSQLVQFRWTRAQADSSMVADSSRREATFAHMSGGAYIVVSPGAVHNSFSDFGVIVPSRFPLARQDFRRTIEITNAYLLAFFDRYLRGRSSALLTGKSARYPEVTLTVYRPGGGKRVWLGAPTWERARGSR